MFADTLLSLKFCVSESLGGAVEEFWQTLVLNHGTGLLREPLEIGLSAGKHPTRIFYRWTAGLKWAKPLQQDAMAISTQIATYLGIGTTTVLELNGIEFSVEVMAPGWIDFHVTEVGLGSWLKHLTCGNSFRLHSPLDRLDDRQGILGVQYAHARCCALLRLADQEGLIQLKTLPALLSVPVLLCLEPDPWPWFDELGALRLTEPVEQRLIKELVIAVDAVAESQKHSGIDFKKRAMMVATAFEQFYRLCRIWGEVKRETPKLAQARLGLVLSTQTVLRILLQEGCRVNAPVEF